MPQQTSRDASCRPALLRHSCPSVYVQVQRCVCMKVLSVSEVQAAANWSKSSRSTAGSVQEEQKRDARRERMAQRRVRHGKRDRSVKSDARERRGGASEAAARQSDMEAHD